MKKKYQQLNAIKKEYEQCLEQISQQESVYFNNRLIKQKKFKNFGFNTGKTVKY